MRNYTDEPAQVVLAEIRELEFAWNDSRTALESFRDRPSTDPAVRRAEEVYEAATRRLSTARRGMRRRIAARRRAAN